MTFRKMSAFKEAKYSHLNERHVSSECEMFPLIHDTNLQFINKLSLCPTCRTSPAPWLPRLGVARLVTSCCWLLVTEEAEAAQEQEPVTCSQELRWPVVSVVRGCSYYCH